MTREGGIHRKKRARSWGFKGDASQVEPPSPLGKERKIQNLAFEYFLVVKIMGCHDLINQVSQ